ncbi:MAG: hypothetical protein R3C53_04645 [Pirellulaceae bacterium]
MSNTVHLVFLVHGIRDRAPWQAALQTALENDSFKICQCGYGYFDVVRFWWPGRTRQVPIALVERQIRGYIARAKRKYDDVKISVIAHSFGTYIVSRILEEATDLHWERIVFCGAIVPEDFRWDKVDRQVDPEHVVNDVGNQDIWPAMAKLLSFGYGDAGSHGFVSDVNNRFHKSGHSDYFRNGFPAKFWAPWIHAGDLVEVTPPASPSVLAGWLGTAGLNYLGFTLVFTVVLTIAAAYFALPLALYLRAWWAVYFCSVVSGLGAFFLLTRWWHRILAILIILGATVGARAWLGDSRFRVDSQLIADMAASGSWDLDGRLAIKVRDIPNAATLAPNRLSLFIVQGTEEREVRSANAPQTGLESITQTVDGLQKNNSVHLRILLYDPNGIKIDDRIAPIQIQGN